MEALKLTLMKRWFDEIATGFKREEYREIKKYWNSRLLNPDGAFKSFCEVQFRNGYGEEKPFMIVEWKGTDYGEDHEGNRCFVIKLGNVILFKNYQAPES